MWLSGQTEPASLVSARSPTIQPLCGPVKLALQTCVKARRAPPDLVKNNEALGGSIVQNVGRFVHFDQEGRFPLNQPVRSPDPGEDSIDHAYRSFSGGNVGAHLSQEHPDRLILNNHRLGEMGVVILKRPLKVNKVQEER